MLSLSLIFYIKLNFRNNLKYSLLLSLLPILLIFFLNINIEKIKTVKNEDNINEFVNIQEFFKKNNFTKTNNKLFTNDKDIMLLWLLNDNSQLSISWGFVNSLKNKEIETNLINNLKNFGVSDKEFKSMISFGKSKLRENTETNNL